ncbi:hypothetical protein ACFL0M_02520 [Thermodesulfobacteriota bacterium]
MIIQIYEIQTPAQAEDMIALGVDHIGSVVLNEEAGKVPSIKETINLVHAANAKSSLIPLFSDTDTILRLLDYYRPDIVHFCEDITNPKKNGRPLQDLIKNQERVKSKFSPIRIMRSIPIVPTGMQDVVATLQFARMFEPVSDLFLTDTCLLNKSGMSDAQQPVSGFIGITGQLCDWEIAAKLVEQSCIPVILAGGISPDNVFMGIKQVRPAGVDSCTGSNALDSEGRPIRFKKDREKVKHLVNEVRRAEQAFGI